MKITNNKNLPQIIVDAVANDDYDGGERTDYSATTLIKPGHQVQLQAKHKDGIVEDAADRLWSMYGSAVHYIIERAAKDTDIIEERFYSTVNGKVISAQIDHFRDGDLSDWKLTGAYKVKKALQGDHQDWTEQLNIQAYLMGMNGIEVEKAFIGAMCRDWSKQKWMTEDGYPDQIEYIEIPLWSPGMQYKFILDRIAVMEAPEPCSQAERWQDDPTYALIKEGAARAIKVEKTKKACIQVAFDKGLLDDNGNWTKTDHSIETRRGPNRRCEFYCNVNTFCDFYKANYMAAEDLPFRSSKK